MKINSQRRSDINVRVRGVVRILRKTTYFRRPRRISLRTRAATVLCGTTYQALLRASCAGALSKQCCFSENAASYFEHAARRHHRARTTAERRTSVSAGERQRLDVFEPRQRDRRRLLPAVYFAACMSAGTAQQRT